MVIGMCSAAFAASADSPHIREVLLTKLAANEPNAETCTTLRTEKFRSAVTL